MNTPLNSDNTQEILLNCSNDFFICGGGKKKKCCKKYKKTGKGPCKKCPKNIA